jgi:lysozyme family protein
MASLDLYFEHPLRKLLSTSNNDATVNPLANDAGNWTGCVPYVGNLVGTYRDISACLLSDYLGRPATVYDLRALTEQDVKNLFRIYFWDKLGGDSIPSQDVANIATQNYAHFGNVRNIQRALNRLGENLSVDGVSGSLTRQALARQAAINPARYERRYLMLLSKAIRFTTIALSDNIMTTSLRCKRLAVVVGVQ